MQEDKLLGMTATMQQWRTLAGQMTEERDAALIEVEKLREAAVYIQAQRLRGMLRPMMEEKLTEERNTVLEEVARLRTILEKLLAAHSRGCRCLVCDVARDVLRGE